MLKRHLWSVVAGLCLIVSAVFLWRSRMDAAFVMATLGVVAWFLNLRNQFQKAHIETNNTPHVESESSED